MSERVIEPSEIVIERMNKSKENITRANPWIRFLARGVDYSLFFLFLLFSRKLLHGQLPFGKYEHFIPFEFFIWIPLEALLLRIWGATPGKWFLRTRLKQGKKHKLPYLTGLKRGFSVWLRGLGMGIPVLNVFCLLIAYNKLMVFQITSWDRDDRIAVVHYPIGRWRIYVAVFVAAASILYYYSEKNLELKNAARRLVRSIDESPPPPLFAARFHFSTEDTCCCRCYGK